jgi:UDP-GlcNAc:undecaprenyl-phosphate GlcNAc-1-phosphate transferase
MPETIDALYAFLVAGILSWLLVPATESLARRIGALDEPKERSLHSVPTPKLGGLAILAGVLAAGLVGSLAFEWLPWNDQTKAILAGAGVIAAVGVADDVFDLPPGWKLLGQVVAVVIPVSEGVKVQTFTVPFIGGLNPASVDLFDLPLIGTVDLGFIGTVVGIVAIINVINFIDGVDGLAAGVCAIAATTLAIIALSLDRNAAGVLAALTAGGALGFLRHGFPPASSFMGDTGSNLLGYLLGAIAVQGALKTNAVVALFFPLIILAVPILDSSFVVAKRLKYRRPIYVGDRSHFHHRMANIGFSQRRTLAYLYGWALVMAGLALALRFVPYSDDGGNFDAAWTAVMVGCGLIAFAASVYLVYVLEILKLHSFRLHQIIALRKRAGEPPPAEAEVDEGVARELETGEFAAVDPDTGELKRLDPETGEFELDPDAARPRSSVQPESERPAGG